MGRGLGWGTPRGPFQTQPFRDSVTAILFCLGLCYLVPHHQGLGTPSVPGTPGISSIPQHLGSTQAGALPGCRYKSRSGCGTSSWCTDIWGLPPLPAFAGGMLCQLSCQSPLLTMASRLGQPPPSLGTLVLGTESLPCTLGLCEVSAHVPCTDAGSSCWECSPRLWRAPGASGESCGLGSCQK